LRAWLCAEQRHVVAKLILLTGMRPGEALHIARADFDGEEWYNLRAAHVKNGVVGAAVWRQRRLLTQP